MVTQLVTAATRLGVRDTLARYLERSLLRDVAPGRRGVARPVSIREIQRRTGVPRSTIQDFLADPSRARPRTVQRMEALLDDPRLVLSQPGTRVTFVDAPRFTAQSLRNVQVPEEATAVRIISESIASPGREFGSTSWLDIEDDLGQQVIDAVGSTDVVARVLFDTSR